MKKSFDLAIFYLEQFFTTQLLSKMIHLYIIQMEEITKIIDFQAKAKSKLKEETFGYFASGSDQQITLRNNITSFSRIYLYPRTLVDVSKICLRTKILGIQTKLPFGIAPFAMQKLLHPLGELVTAKEAMAHQTAYGLSMLTTTQMSQIIKVNPTGFKILQLNFMKNPEFPLEVLKVAQNYGFKAIAITVDSQTFGKRRRDQRAKYQPQVTLELFNELGYDIKLRNLQNPNKSLVHLLKNDSTWEDIKWIKQKTNLKIILKGVISPEDIPIAEQHKVDAIWISNHGGRQLDTAPATIVALPFIRKKVQQIGSKMEIYIDGGIKKGEDIFKCLALGADFVFIGRGFLFSIIDGEEGVRNVFKILTNGLMETMRYCGTRSVEQISNDYILRYPQPKM